MRTYMSEGDKTLRLSSLLRLVMDHFPVELGPSLGHELVDPRALISLIVLHCLAPFYVRLFELLFIVLFLIRGRGSAIG